MVEVFKTNVTDHHQARWLIEQIHRTCTSYRANFDLDDCDKILRIKPLSGAVQPEDILALLKAWGYEAQVLQDDYPLLEAKQLRFHCHAL